MLLTLDYFLETGKFLIFAQKFSSSWQSEKYGREKYLYIRTSKTGLQMKNAYNVAYDL